MPVRYIKNKTHNEEERFIFDVKKNNEEEKDGQI
jgi:hypothetical protein